MVVDLHRLQFLREVAARGTMTAAAEALSYTPSAVSQQLSVLEKELGTALLERQGRTVVLTPAGRALVHEAEAVFAAAERATSAVQAAAGQVSGPVDVGAFQSVGATLVPAAFAALHRSHPELEVHFRQWDLHGLRELALGHLDICIDQEYDLLPHRRHEGFDQRLLLVEPVFLAVPQDLDDGPDIEAYADRIWASAERENECGLLVERLCGRAGFEPKVRYHTDDLEVTLQLVSARMAVGILPRLAAFRVPPGVVIHPIDGAQRHVKALMRPEVVERPAVAVVLDALAEAGASLGR